MKAASLFVAFMLPVVLVGCPPPPLLHPRFHVLEKAILCQQTEPGGFFEGDFSFQFDPGTEEFEPDAAQELDLGGSSDFIVKICESVTSTEYICPSDPLPWIRITPERGTIRPWNVRKIHIEIQGNMESDFSKTIYVVYIDGVATFPNSTYSRHWVGSDSVPLVIKPYVIPASE